MYSQTEGYSFVDKEGVTQEVEPRFDRQIKSLSYFAEPLGYLYKEGKFVSVDAKSKHMKVVSLNTMVRWHNCCFMHMEGCWHSLEAELPKVSRRLGFSVKDLGYAIRSKSVHHVHLQGKKAKRHRMSSKKNNTTQDTIVVQSHLVKYIK